MLRALAAFVALWPAVICAQAERVTIRLAPAPGQRLHTRMAGEGHLVVDPLFIVTSILMSSTVTRASTRRSALSLPTTLVRPIVVTR